MLKFNSKFAKSLKNALHTKKPAKSTHSTLGASKKEYISVARQKPLYTGTRQNAVKKSVRAYFKAKNLGAFFALNSLLLTSFLLKFSPLNSLAFCFADLLSNTHFKSKSKSHKNNVKSKNTQPIIAQPFFHQSPFQWL